MLEIIMIVLMFALIVVVHELGHFIAAKTFDVKVNEFAVGMGPKLWSKQRGETLYSFRALPIGGFCAMEGENGDSEDKGSMFNKKPWQKLIIFAAGALMNFLLGWIIFTVIIGYQGYASNKILQVEPDMPAAIAGLVAGDRIIAIDGLDVNRLEDINTIVTDKEKTYTFTVQKESGEQKTINIMPDQREATKGKFGFIVAKERGNILESLGEGFKANFVVAGQVLGGFSDLITGQVGIDQMSGIVGVAQVTSQVWNEGMEESFLTAVMDLLYIAGILSVNLGVFNLLPLPALDGGRIFFSLVEIIRRKPIDPEKEGIVHIIGFVLLMILMVVVLYNDIARIWVNR